MKYKIKIEDIRDYKKTYGKMTKPSKEEEGADLDDFIFKDEHIKYHSER